MRSTLDQIIDENQEPVAAVAVLLGVAQAGKEAREEYGDPATWPEPLRKFLDRSVEIAEEFINRVIPPDNDPEPVAPALRAA